VIGTTLQIIGESLCEAVDVEAGWKVLDVAAGNGNASLAAARRGCDVTCTDYVDTLLGLAQRRAEADGLHITTQIADAENLPFDDDSFDAVLSTVGVMFAPNPEESAAELIRVCKPGGKIGLANWTPEGFVGQMFKVIGGLVPPPVGVPSPLQWGTDVRLNELLGADCVVEITRKNFVFRYRSADEYFDTFKDFYGPTVKAWAALDDKGKAQLRGGLMLLADKMNRATGSLAVPSEYVEVVATKR
jgi:SAM-dependent methyltransferase